VEVWPQPVTASAAAERTVMSMNCSLFVIHHSPVIPFIPASLSAAPLCGLNLIAIVRGLPCGLLLDDRTYLGQP
jgi:hypothetical protein